MITTTPLHGPKAPPRTRGFTLVEVIVGSTLAGFVLLAMLTTFLFLGRSGTNLRNYSDMESQAHKALEIFAEDTRQASAVTWASADSVTMVVNSVNVTYTYASGTFSRSSGANSTTLLTGITSFNFLAYTITGTAITDFSTSAARTAADGTTKQIQISLSAARTSTTVTSATNLVLSARYVLRNKHVTA